MLRVENIMGFEYKQILEHQWVQMRWKQVSAYLQRKVDSSLLVLGCKITDILFQHMM